MFVIFLLVSTLFANSYSEVIPLIFNQKLDHFNPNDTTTFQQSYFIVTDHWNREAKAPVMLFLGLAAPFPSFHLDYGVIGPALTDYQALGVGIENRFYGQSLNQDMLKLENLKYLTLEQSLQDTIAIQAEIKKNYSIDDLNWITFGASYSGMKSTIHRLTFPNNFYAAFASSAPVNFQYDLSNYLGHVGEVISRDDFGGGQTCFDSVRQAFAQVDGLLANNSIDILIQDFNICNKNVNISDPREKFAIAMYLGGFIANFDQFSFANPYTNPYASICRPFSIKSRTPYETLKLIVQTESDSTDCADASYQALLNPLLKWGNGIGNWTEYEADPGGRAWGYEICKNIGFNAYCDVNKGCPLSNFSGPIGQISMCFDVFNITEDQMRSANQKFLQTYGGAAPNTTRLLMTNGYVDCGYPYGLITSNNDQEIYAIVNPITGHVADINPPKIYEPLILSEMRQNISKILDKWVEEATIKQEATTEAIIEAATTQEATTEATTTQKATSEATTTPSSGNKNVQNTLVFIIFMLFLF